MSASSENSGANRPLGWHKVESSAPLSWPRSLFHEILPRHLHQTEYIWTHNRIHSKTAKECTTFAPESLVSLPDSVKHLLWNYRNMKPISNQSSSLMIGCLEYEAAVAMPRLEPQPVSAGVSQCQSPGAGDFGASLYLRSQSHGVLMFLQSRIQRHTEWDTEWEETRMGPIWHRQTHIYFPRSRLLCLQMPTLKVGLCFN